MNSKIKQNQNNFTQHDHEQCITFIHLDISGNRCSLQYSERQNRKVNYIDQRNIS